MLVPLESPRAFDMALEMVNSYTRNICRIVPYDAQAHASFDEALYAAEFIAGYEHRVKLKRTYGNMDARNWHNPHPMGTPEQKWFENGYYAAAKEERMSTSAGATNPQQEVCCVKSKLNEKLGIQEKKLNGAFMEYGKAVFNGHKTKTVNIHSQLETLTQQANDTRTAIGVVNGLA
jgi:hypothetical protein